MPIPVVMDSTERAVLSFETLESRVRIPLMGRIRGFSARLDPRFRKDRRGPGAILNCT